MKSQKPFYCTAYGFFAIGHNRITQVSNTNITLILLLGKNFMKFNFVDS